MTATRGDCSHGPGSDAAVAGVSGPLTVGEVARRLVISVRTLHHYDEVGLATPAERTASGYRMYRSDDLARLARVLEPTSSAPTTPRSTRP